MIMTDDEKTKMVSAMEKSLHVMKNTNATVKRAIRLLEVSTQATSWTASNIIVREALEHLEELID